MKRNCCLGLIAALTFFAGTGKVFSFTTTGFSAPYGVAFDPQTNFIYVSNIVGAFDAKDNNGFISRLKADGTLENIHFIRGGFHKAVLNAPKGMVVMGDFLFVADIDHVRVFDLNTAQGIFSINFGTYPIQHFFGLEVGPDNALYVADGPANTIYRIDVRQQYRVTYFIQGDQLGQPRSLRWSPARQVFMVSGWSSGQILAFDSEGKRTKFPGIWLKSLEGMEVDAAGMVYVASSGLKAVYKIMADGTLTGFQLGLNDPVGLALHRAENQLLVVSTSGNSLQSFPVK